MQMLLVKDIDFKDSARQDRYLSLGGGSRISSMNMTMTSGRGQNFGSQA